MLDMTVELITPERAKEYLEANKVNRIIRSRHLNDLIRDMKAGNWQLTPHGIVFDENGNIVDGQHRLTAIALSGVTVDMVVTRGVDPEVVKNIDTGLSRDYADYLKFSGEEGDPALRHKKTIATIRTIVRAGYNQSLTLTNSELGAALKALEPSLQQLYKICITRGKAVPSAVSAGILSALLCGESQTDCYHFASVFINGDTKDCEEYNVGAAFRLSTILMDAKIKRIILSKEKIYKLTQNAIWQFIHGNETKALREPKQLRYKVDVIFKTILGGKNNA